MTNHISYHIMSCHIMPHHATSYHIISCRINSLTNTTIKSRRVKFMYFIIELLKERSKAAGLEYLFFPTQFYTNLSQGGKYMYRNVRRWSKRQQVKIIDLKKVFIPIHVGNSHWCLAVINFCDKNFEYYDSLGGDGKTCLNYLRQYVGDEAKRYSDVDYKFTGWSNIYPTNIPQQLNDYDCGVFTLKYADYLSDSCPFNFSQDDMSFFRKLMILQINYNNLQGRRTEHVET